MNGKYLIIAVVVAVFGIAVFFLSRPVTLENPRLINKASYVCENGKMLSAAFYEGVQNPTSTPGQPPKPSGSVELVLNDGKKINLPQTISANGGRYADSDESFVFWSKGYGAFIIQQSTTTYANCLEKFPMRAFANPDGKYGFQVPGIWNVAVNNYNKNNTLFGPEANGTSGLGGIEVFPNQKSIDSFFNGTSAKYTDKNKITVDGVPGVRARYQGAQMGEQVVLLKNGTIYNIYIASIREDDLGYFNQIISSFKFNK
jgi:membrane-bound inhibitor of C-type lysozyme